MRGSKLTHRSSFEVLEPRKLLAAAADAVRIAGDSFRGLDEQGDLSVLFHPETRSVLNRGGFLTAKKQGDALAIAKDFLFANTQQLGITAEDVRTASVQSAVRDSETGTTYIWMRQVINGLPVENTGLGINIDRFGRVINAFSSFVPSLTDAAVGVAVPVVSQMIHPTNVLRAAADGLGVAFSGALDALRFEGGTALAFSAESDELSHDPIPVTATYYATQDGLRLAWKTLLVLPDGSDATFDLAVDAKTGQIIHADNLTEYLSHDHDGDGHDDHTADAHFTPTAAGVVGTGGTYNVYPVPLESPYDGPRQMVNNPADLVASPFGWHDTNGVVGPEFTDTRGNNVQAQDDTDANNTGGSRPDGGTGLVFDFPIDLATQAPAAYIPAAVTNLFYWVNTNHDLFYTYGFTEQFWNFQTNNYGRGGLGNDHINADAQDGSGTNNANFTPSAEGSPGRIQMYRFTAAEPDRDGDLDNGIITHEYTHGVSNRLAGRGATGGLSPTQSGGMGEGWGDFFGLMFSQKTTDVLSQPYPIGTYALNQPPDTGAGVRRKPYSFDKAIDPLTWEVFGTSGTVTYPGHAPITRSTQVHNTGEIWCSALWDMNWLLIQKHGFDADIYSGYNPSGTPAQQAGNKLAMRLVVEGMRLMPIDPSFIDARDGILQADVNITGGANQNEIWEAFARRGLGANASVTSATATSVNVDFSVPWPDPVVASHTPTTGSIGAQSVIQLKFNEAMNQSSFSVVDDVVEFTGPGGTNILSKITGSSWVNSTTLQINTTPLTANGAYSLTIGPDIRSADNNNEMDQDRDSIRGEATDDRYTANFSVTMSQGPELFGYSAAEFPVEPINLVIGQPGVNILVNASDDAAGTITLPSGTTFNYYGNTFGTIFANANGLVTLGTSSTSFTNGNLSTAPSQAAIAVLWDDWRTDQTTPGEPDSAVLWKLDGDRLIIEWSDIPNRTASNGAATFQAILQLNTGAVPGRIIANYVDIDAGSSTQTGGLSASVGIKDAGTQSATAPSRRLLVSQNTNTQPWVKTGKAVLFAQDVTPPGVDASAYAVNPLLASVTFSEDVGAVLSAGDVSVQNLTTASPVATGFAYNSGTRVLELALPDTLDDGNYRATVSSAGVPDAAGNPLDGDGNGVAGGDHVLDFFFFRGDATGDRTIDIDDFSVLGSNFNNPGDYTDGDFDFNGAVDIDDFSILAGKFNTTLAAAARPAGSAGGAQSAQSAGPTASAGKFTGSVFGNDRLIDDLLSSQAVLPA